MESATGRVESDESQQDKGREAIRFTENFEFLVTDQNCSDIAEQAPQLQVH